MFQIQNIIYQVDNSIKNHTSILFFWSFGVGKIYHKAVFFDKIEAKQLP